MKYFQEAKCVQVTQQTSCSFMMFYGRAFTSQQFVSLMLRCRDAVCLWSLLMTTSFSSLGYHNPKVVFLDARVLQKESQTGVERPPLLLTDTLCLLTCKMGIMTPVLPTSGPKDKKRVKGQIRQVLHTQQPRYYSADVLPCYLNLGTNS